MINNDAARFRFFISFAIASRASYVEYGRHEARRLSHNHIDGVAVA